MVGYRRNFVTGGTFFFTLTLEDRTSRTLIEHTAILRAAMQEVRRSRPFAIEAVVVLPDHLHMIMSLPEGDADYPNRWSLIKRRFTEGIIECGIAVARHRNGELALWQRRYWEHTIRDDADFTRHIDYVHYNPVRHSLVARVCDWPHSSFHRYVRQELLPQDWAGDFSQDGANFGERRW